jgi:hypothetical protein
MGIIFIQTCYNPKSAYDYQIHDTDTARKQKKYLYDPSERTSTIENFDTEEKLDENAELFNDLMEMLYSKMTWQEFIAKKPKRIHMITNIRVSFEILFREIYGYPYYQLEEREFWKRKKELQKTEQPKIAPPPKVELIPIDTPKDMPW